MKQSKVLRARRRIALEITDSLEAKFKIKATDWDVDVAADIIESHIPLTNAEAQAEYDAQMSGGEPRKATGPSLPDRLRKAMGMDNPPVSLTQLFEAAIKLAEKSREAPAETLAEFMSRLEQTPPAAPVEQWEPKSPEAKARIVEFDGPGDL